MESNYTLSNEEKALAKIYKEPDLVQFFQQAFSKGIALDCVDVHDRRKEPDLDKTERYIYDCADKALDLIDLDDLYDKAEDLNPLSVMKNYRLRDDFSPVSVSMVNCSSLGLCPIL